MCDDDDDYVDYSPYNDDDDNDGIKKTEYCSESGGRYKAGECRLVQTVKTDRCTTCGWSYEYP